MHTDSGAWLDNVTKHDASAFLADKAGITDLRDLHWQDRSSSCGTEQAWEITAQRWPAGEAFVVGTITELIEPPPGWEDRAVERARRDGVLSPAGET